MDACIHTRLEDIYDDFNDVLDFHVMLVGGSGPHEGRVEIVHQGRHGTICNYLWDWKDASVVCKMLGFRIARTSHSNKDFGNGTGEILLDEVGCNGDEGSLLNCVHKGIRGYAEIDKSYCKHTHDAEIECRTLRHNSWYNVSSIS